MSMFLDILNNQQEQLKSLRDLYQQHEELTCLIGKGTAFIRWILQDPNLQIYRTVLFVCSKVNFKETAYDCWSDYLSNYFKYVVIDIFANSDLEAKQIAKKSWSLLERSNKYKLNRIEVYRTNSLRFYSEFFFDEKESNFIFQGVDYFLMFDDRYLEQVKDQYECFFEHIKNHDWWDYHWNKDKLDKNWDKKELGGTC